jgi:hypothetical protein
MSAFQFYLQSGKHRNLGWVGTTVMLFLVKNSLVKKGNVRRRAVVMQQPINYLNS